MNKPVLLKKEFPSIAHKEYGMIVKKSVNNNYMEFYKNAHKCKDWVLTPFILSDVKTKISLNKINFEIEFSKKEFEYYYIPYKIFDTDFDICNHISEILETDLETLIKKETRLRAVVYKKMLISYIANNFFGLPVLRIGKVFNKDHSTIVHYISYMDNMLNMNQNYKNSQYDLKLIETYINDVKKFFKSFVLNSIKNN